MAGRFASAVTLGIASAGVAGCTCRSDPPPEPPPAHYEGWEGLVGAVAAADLETARKLAQELDGGPLAEADDAGAAEVGAGLGFLGIAEDASEAADGLAAAASGCGDCHAARSVRPLDDRPPWEHHTGARWAVWGLVWNDAAAPPAGDATLNPLALCWADPVDTDVDPERGRAARLVASCAECHAKR
jgi:mono/diheme cytochrome c family protein